MAYVALFLWFAVSLLIGSGIHRILQGTSSYRLVRFLSTPGIAARKFAQTLTALICGATVTGVQAYDASEPDIRFDAEGATSVARVLVPFTPLLCCAVVMAAVNGIMDSPLQFVSAPPSLPSLDATGIRSFVQGAGSALTQMGEQTIQANWQSLKVYVLLAAIFTLALGASVPIERLRDAMLGAALVSVVVALTCGLLASPGGGSAEPVAPSAAARWALSLQAFVQSCSGLAFAMMVIGMLEAILLGVGVRIYELAKKQSAGGRRAKVVTDD